VNALSHVWNVKIQEKTQLVAAEAQIRQQLSAVHWQNSFDAFDLDDQTLLDDEIDAVRRAKLNAFVHDGQSDFLFKLNTRLRELIGQTSAAGTFEDPGAEHRMDAYRGADHDATGWIRSHETVTFPFVSFVSFVSSRR
jgi:hypothetical protein